jgi:glutathione S-transferase
MIRIDIYGPTGSPFVVKVLAAADYMNLDYTHHGDMSLREVYKLSPTTGRIPVAHFDGKAVFDSTLILRRLESLSPSIKITSQDPQIAAQERMLEDCSDESFYWHMMGLRWIKENAHRSVKQNSRYLPLLIRPFAGILFRNFIGSRTRAQGFGRLPYDILLAELGERLDDLVAMLGSQKFFFGDKPCVADFAIYGQFDTGIEEGVTPDFAEQVFMRPTLVEWRQHVLDLTND